MYLIIFAGALQAEEKNSPHLTCKEITSGKRFYYCNRIIRIIAKILYDFKETYGSAQESVQRHRGDDFTLLFQAFSDPFNTFRITKDDQHII